MPAPPDTVRDELARLAEGRAMAALASFDNARRHPNSRDPIPAFGSGGYHLDQASYDRVVRRTRHHFRNSHVFQAILVALADFVVGPEVRVRAQSGDPEWNRRAEDLFAAHTEDPDAFDARGDRGLSEVLRAATVDLALEARLAIIRRPGVTGRGLPAFEAVEGARLRNPSGQVEREGFRGGVERGPDGRVRAVWIGDWSPYGGHVEEPVRVDFDAVLLVHDDRLPQSGASAGCAFPLAGSVVDRLELLEKSNEATHVAYVMSAMLALLIERERPDGVFAERVAQGLIDRDLAEGAATTETAETLAKRGELAPGLFAELGMGERAFQVKPEHPTTPYFELYWMELQTIAATLGVPLELAFTRLIKNFHATRSAIAIAEKGFAVRRRHLHRRIVAPVWRSVVGRLVRDGVLEPVSGWARCVSHMASPPVLDPKSEFEAYAFATSAELLTHAEALRRVGDEGGIEAFLATRARETSLFRDAGVEPTRPVVRTKVDSRSVEDGAADEDDAGGDGGDA